MPRPRRPLILLTRLAPPRPPSATRAELNYYEKQIESQEAIVVSLTGGQELIGRLTWHDRSSLGLVTRDGEDLALPKRRIRYLYKPPATPAPARRRRRTP